MRALAHGLRPPALDALGVVATIEDHCRAFGQRTGLRIEFARRAGRRARRCTTPPASASTAACRRR
ncbi:MAG: hypothetical protein U0470_01940 [Anaerolineae bacterium]